MKHVIVIETVDEEAGGKPLADFTAERLLVGVEYIIREWHHETCFIQSRFNVSSATAAVHEMYGLTPWNPEIDS